jgi:hypothetical protein
MSEREPIHPLASWNGEPIVLLEFDDDLCDDAALCDTVFLSKQEAYLQGRIVGKLLADQNN